MTDKTPAENIIDREESRVDQSAPLFADVGGVSGQRLRQYVERIERLLEEVAGLQDDIKQVYGESKSAGYDTKIMRKVIALRKLDSQKRQEQQELLELYSSALGML